MSLRASIQRFFDALHPPMSDAEVEECDRFLFEDALAVVISHARRDTGCPSCGSEQTNATSWMRHDTQEVTRNFFECSSCGVDFYYDSDVLTTCGLGALAVYDRCQMYGAIDEIVWADQLVMEGEDERATNDS